MRILPAAVAADNFHKIITVLANSSNDPAAVLKALRAGPANSYECQGGGQEEDELFHFGASNSQSV